MSGRKSWRIICFSEFSKIWEDRNILLILFNISGSCKILLTNESDNMANNEATGHHVFWHACWHSLSSVCIFWYIHYVILESMFSTIKLSPTFNRMFEIDIKNWLHKRNPNSQVSNKFMILSTWSWVDTHNMHKPRTNITINLHIPAPLNSIIFIFRVALENYHMIW